MRKLIHGSTALLGRQRLAFEVFVGLLIFVLFLLAYILLVEQAGSPAISIRPDGTGPPTPDYRTLQGTLSLVRHSRLLLPATTLLGGCLGAVYWRLIGLTGRYNRSAAPALAEADDREDVGSAATLLVGAITGVFCAFILPAALLSAESDFAAYNARTLALLAVVAGYGGCNAFGNVGRLLSEVLRSQQSPLDAAMLRQVIDTPLRETVSTKLDERFSPPQIPRYTAHLSSDLLLSGESLFHGKSESDRVLLFPGEDYTLSIRLDPREPGPARSILLRNEFGPSEAEIAFDIEVEADRLSVAPMRVRLLLRDQGPIDTASVKLVATNPDVVDPVVDDEIAACFIRVSAYCRGSPAGRLLLPFSVQPVPTA